MTTNEQISEGVEPVALSGDELVAVIGNAPPSPVWPIYAWGLVWTLWLMFLLFMVVQR